MHKNIYTRKITRNEIYDKDGCKQLRWLRAGNNASERMTQDLNYKIEARRQVE
jgi:hypothetical protein